MGTDSAHILHQYVLTSRESMYDPAFRLQNHLKQKVPDSYLRIHWFARDGYTENGVQGAMSRLRVLGDD